MVQLWMAYITKMILNASTLLKKCDIALQKSLQARLLNLLSCSLYSNRQDQEQMRAFYGAGSFSVVDKIQSR